MEREYMEYDVVIVGARIDQPLQRGQHLVPLARHGQQDITAGAGALIRLGREAARGGRKAAQTRLA